MENNNFLKTARELLKQNKFSEAKNHYDLYIIRLNSNLNLNDLSELVEISEEYINTVLIVFNLDLFNNPIYKIFDETKHLIQTKSNNNEPLTEFEDNVKKLIIYEPYYKIHWGNYAETKITNIIEKDTEYFLWCVINLVHFAIDKSIFLIEEIQKEPLYINALLVNSIKHSIVEKWDNDNDDEYGDNPDDYDDGPDDYDDGPSAWGYDSWDEMTFHEAFEGDIDSWNLYNL